MKTYQIRIGGESFPIRSDAEPEQIEELENELRRRFEDVNNRKGPKSSQGFRAMAMVAIILLDELREIKKRHETMGKETVEFAQRISTRIDTLLEDGF